MALLPVLYLDLDDTVVLWSEGRPAAAPGAYDFLHWALARFEVRWLTTWCPNGEMPEDLLVDLARMVGFEPGELRHIRGVEWDAEVSKLNGIAWLEHTVLERPFVWLEDDYGFRERERSFLEEAGFIESYRHCNVAEDRHALIRSHAWLSEWVIDRTNAAA